ncbi:MAG: hypothetical protein AAFN30_15630 [Actinomycetota bacterium]
MPELDARAALGRGCFEAVITAVHHRWIVLDHTQFQPATPERQSDTGHVDGIAVVSVDEGCAGLLHRVGDPMATQGLAMGQVVKAEVDLQRRHRLMQLHSLQHLLYLAYQLAHGRSRRLSGTVTDRWASVEVEQQRSSFEVDLDGIRDWIEQVIADDLVISSLARPPERGRRFWHVDGVGTIACEARHPASTGAIGLFGLRADHGDAGLVQLSATLLDV